MSFVHQPLLLLKFIYRFTCLLFQFFEISHINIKCTVVKSIKRSLTVDPQISFSTRYCILIVFVNPPKNSTVLNRNKTVSPTNMNHLVNLTSFREVKIDSSFQNVLCFTIVLKLYRLMCKQSL